jgi:hypothetical protein
MQNDFPGNAAWSDTNQITCNISQGPQRNASDGYIEIGLLANKFNIRPHHPFGCYNPFRCRNLVQQTERHHFGCQAGFGQTRGHLNGGNFNRILMDFAMTGTTAQSAA